MHLQEQILTILNDFSDIVSGHTFQLSVSQKGKEIVYLKLNLVNTHLIFAKDVLVVLENHSIRRKYSYQWMDAENQLIIRWDNAQHHPHLANAPFHRHLHSDENVEPAPEITLREVLEFIRSKIV